MARQALGSKESVVLRGDVVTLWPSAEVAVDVLAFEDEARRALRTGDPHACAEVALRFGGELLPNGSTPPFASSSGCGRSWRGIWACCPAPRQSALGIGEKSNSVLADMAGRAQWLHSYVTDDNIFCVYVAPDEATVREHATRGGFPVASVNRVVRVIDPTTGGM